jgi:transposase
MGKEISHAPSTVHRIWRAFGLQPHRVETFKLSSDPLFVEKVRDIVGLYLSPPERAVMLCVDEKSQVQALGRTQPLWPMRPGQAERRTHDYKRHGTTSLFAALDVKAGTVVGKCMSRHRAMEFRKFLDEVERNVPTDLDIHVVMDNYGTHKTKLIRNWFAKRPRWHVHLTPTSASWINQVERFFALLTERALKRGVFRSVADLEKAIKAYIEATNAHPKPFRWIGKDPETKPFVGFDQERRSAMVRMASNEPIHPLDLARRDQMPTVIVSRLDDWHYQTAPTGNLSEPGALARMSNN